MIDFGELFAFCNLHVSRWSLFRPWSLDRPMYYDRQGFPIPGDGTKDGAVLAWARMKDGRDDYNIVAKDELPDGSRLSTVWLGLDHGFAGPPLIFETMRFARDTVEKTMPFSRRSYFYQPAMEFPDPESGELTEQLRYTTEEEALAAHHEILRRIRVREGH
jgi:hypothetical protein